MSELTCPCCATENAYECESGYQCRDCLAYFQRGDECADVAFASVTVSPDISRETAEALSRLIALAIKGIREGTIK